MYWPQKKKIPLSYTVYMHISTIVMAFQCGVWCHYSRHLYAHEEFVYVAHFNNKGIQNADLNI